MMMSTRHPLDFYLALDYPFQAIADPEGGYTILFPDLPGCLSVADDLAEIPAMAADAKRVWMESEYERGAEIPLPSQPEEYSGKFNLRLPKSLHRRLAEAAARDEVSLNQYVVGLLTEGITGASMLASLHELAAGQAATQRAVASLSTCVEEVRAAMATYTVERPAHERAERRTAERPHNVVLLGAVAA